MRQFSQLPILMLTARVDVADRLLGLDPAREFSRAQLLDAAPAELRDVNDRAIDSHIKNLRRKIDAVEPGGECAASVYGVGCGFDAPG